MRVTLSLQRNIFILLLVIFAIPLLWHGWNIRLLYLDPSIRKTTETAVRAYADREGFILSEIDLRRVTAKTVDIRVREYLRGQDPVSCARLDLPTQVSRSIACDE